jgi:endonuclease/exonuclease/phosphatase family metal-dependent hydrolase
MRVCTWNIRHGELRGLEAVADLLRAQRADLIGLQEIDRGVPRSGGVDQAAWLAEQLGCAAAFGAAIPLDGGQYGVALLVRRELLGGAALTAAPLLLPGGDGPGEERRVLLAAQVGRRRVLVTHLDLPEQLRPLQARAVAEALGDPAEVLLLGDFNEGPEGPAVRTLLQRGLRDAFCLAGAAERSTAPPDRPAARIDLLLLGARAGEVRAAGAVETDASDHPLVFAELADHPGDRGAP